MSTLLTDLVEAHPDGVAVCDERGRTTWHELDRRVDQLVRALRASGLTEGDCVVGMLGNQVEQVELALACMQGGWLLVPLNWHLVADEVRYVLEDAGAAAVVADARWIDVVRDAVDDDLATRLRARLVVHDTGLQDGEMAYEAALVANVDGDPDEPARGGPMFYTSGTTGRPKGVRGPLAVVGGSPEMWLLMAHSMRPVLELPDDDPVQCICGPMYHSAQWVISMFSLLCGARLVLQHRFDAAELLDLLEREQVTNVHLVPTQMSRLLRARGDAAGDSAAERPAALVSVLHGAAPCPPEVKRRMIEWWGPIVTEYYGGTEGGFITTITSAEWLERPTSVGRPLEVVEVLVVDGEGEPAPPGTAGDLYFRSLLGSRFEYHNAPEKTEAAHLQPGVATLGDIGWLDEDGYLHLSDRRIDMIVSGGVNIYPAEVEAALVGAGPVVDAAVFGIPDEDMGESVHAALVLAPGATWDDDTESDLVTRCRTSLAGYKVPRSFEVHAELPRCEAGKLLKRSLRDPWWAETDRSI